MQPEQPQAPAPNPGQQSGPQAMFQPSVQGYQPAVPVTAQPSAVPQGVTPVAANPAVITAQPAKKRSKLPFIIGGVVVLLLIGLTIVALTVGGKTATPKATTTDQTAVTGSGPAAATSGGMQQNYDAISQSLSSLDDNRDFPANALDDTSLAKN